MKQKRPPQVRCATLKRKFQISILLLTVIMVASIGITNFYNFELLTQNAVKNMESGGRLYASYIEANLNAMTKDLLELSSFAYANQDEPSTELDIYLKKQNALKVLQERHQFQEAADVFYMLEQENDEIIMSVSARGFGAQYALETKLRSTACEVFGKWHVDWVQDQPWFFQHYRAGRYTVGVGASLTMFMQETMEQGAVEGISYLMTDAQRHVIFTTNEQAVRVTDTIQPKELLSLQNQWYYMVEIPIADYEGYLYLLQPAQMAVQGQIYSFLLVLFVGLLLVVTATAYLHRLHRNILLPVDSLEAGMERVQKGDWNYRMENQSSIEDFKVLADGFNKMISEIYALKIQAYEARLTQSKNQLAMLRLQLKPHFYLNAITTVSSLLYTERIEDAQRFINALSKHLRYLFSESDLQIPLREELLHCENYVKLQQIKYPDKIFYMASCEPELESFIVSKFMIQTMLENIFKHAFSPDCYLSVFISVTKEQQAEKSFVRIVIEDNGEGFSADVLKGFPNEGLKHHVGLKNIYDTLNLLYGEGPWMQISNVETGGARVVFFLPSEGGSKA